jgi:hypothetical protein
MVMERAWLLVGLMIGLVGCASSTTVRQDIYDRVAVDGRAYLYNIAEFGSNTTDAPPHFVVALKGYLEQDLNQRGMLVGQDAVADREVRVTLEAYRMRSGFSRAMFGAFAGKDGVESAVSVVNAESGALIGSSNVSSFNIMAVGDQDDIARMHAKEIGKFLAGEVKRKK